MGCEYHLQTLVLSPCYADMPGASTEQGPQGEISASV